MKDASGQIIYIGKAKKLKNRVSSYFHGEHESKVAAMVSKVADCDVIIVSSEFEALVLENSLIKQHKPHYNILLKDDKAYPFIRVDIKSAYPNISISQKSREDGALYLGPYGGRKNSRSIITSCGTPIRLTAFFSWQAKIIAVKKSRTDLARRMLWSPLMPGVRTRKV